MEVGVGGGAGGYHFVGFVGEGGGGGVVGGGEEDAVVDVDVSAAFVGVVHGLQFAVDDLLGALHCCPFEQEVGLVQFLRFPGGVVEVGGLLEVF